ATGAYDSMMHALIRSRYYKISTTFSLLLKLLLSPLGTTMRVTATFRPPRRRSYRSFKHRSSSP
ncbi:hypothetical protein CSUI_011400, partial [Cystoisospora suis]